MRRGPLGSCGEKEESPELCLVHFRKREVGSEGMLELDGPL